MSAYNTTLHDEDDNEIYPKTLAENVYDGNTRMDQKVDGIRTDLGSPSSASAVTGADAFSKISTLNSDLTNKIEYRYDTASTPQMAPTGTTSVILNPSYAGKTIVGIMPYCANPQAHTTSYAVITSYDENSKTVSLACLGSGAAQAFTVHFGVFLKPST